MKNGIILAKKSTWTSRLDLNYLDETSLRFGLGSSESARARLCEARAVECAVGSMCRTTSKWPAGSGFRSVQNACEVLH